MCKCIRLFPSNKLTNNLAPPPPNICSNFCLLVLCLIALAAVFGAPRPAQAQTPAAPSNFRVFELSADNIVLAADDVAGRNGANFDIQSGSSWRPVSATFSTSSGTVKLTLSQGERDQVYVAGRTTNFRLRFAVNNRPGQYATLSLHIPPAAPTSLSASAAQTSLTLSWTNPSSDSAVSAEVQIRPASGSFPQAWTAADSATSHSFSGLTADTNYEMRVRASNSATDPGPAASISKRTLAAPATPTPTPMPTSTPVPTSTPTPIPEPSAPAGLNTSGITQTSITLNWTKSSGATFYEVRRGATGGFTRLGNVASHIFTGLNAGSSYTLQVRAGNSGGTSATAQTTASTNNLPPPPAPSAPTSLSASGITQTSITLNWTKSSGATFYEVRRGTTGGFTRLGDVSAHTFAGLSAGRSYTLQVRAGNTGGTSATAQTTASTNNIPATSAPPDFDPPQNTQDSQDSQKTSQSSGSSRRPATATPASQAAQVFPQTLHNLPPGIEVKNWVEGAQGQRVEAQGVGNQAIIDQGLLDAIDLWGYITPGIEVCFAQQGRMMLLDAAFSPRQAMPLAAYQRAGMTCANIDRAGTVVLLRSAEPLPEEPIQMTNHDAVSQPLGNCMVQLNYELNFRAAPAGQHIIQVLPANILLTAFSYHEGWYKVDYYGQRGWVSADYVQAHGDCG